MPRNTGKRQKMPVSQMCFTDISTLWTCQGVSEGVHDNPGCSLTDPRKPHRLNLKLAREEAYISPEPPTLFTEGTPRRALIRKVSSFCGYCRSYSQGASWDEQKDQVCACSHIPFHSLSLQEASAYVKIFSSDFPVEFWSWQQCIRVQV